MALKAPYLLALCDAAQETNMTFGLARGIGAQGSTFDFQAAKVIHSLVTFSPASESLAIEFLNEFQKVTALAHLGSISLFLEYCPWLMESQSPWCYLVKLTLTFTSGHKTQ